VLLTDITTSPLTFPLSDVRTGPHDVHFHKTENSKLTNKKQPVHNYHIMNSYS